MSTLLISIDMIDHDALGLYMDQFCSGFSKLLGAGTGIVESQSFRLVAAPPSLRGRVDVCGRHWSERCWSETGRYDKKVRDKSPQTSGRQEECEGNTLPYLYMRTYMMPETTLKSREYRLFQYLNFLFLGPRVGDKESLDTDPR